MVGVNTSGAAFKPTTGAQVELGVKYQPVGMASNVTGAVFQIDQNNVSTADPNNPFNTVQTGSIRVRGFELEAQANLLRGLNLLGAYTYLDPVVTGANDASLNKQVGGVPRNAASSWLDYAFAPETKLAGVSVGGGVRFVGTTQASNFDLFKVSDHKRAIAALRCKCCGERPAPVYLVAGQMRRSDLGGPGASWAVELVAGTIANPSGQIDSRSRKR